MVLEYTSPFSTGMSASLVIGQSSFTTGEPAASANGLGEPRGAAFDPSGNLWVADSVNNRVLEYSGAPPPSIPEFPPLLALLVLLAASAFLYVILRRGRARGTPAQIMVCLVVPPHVIVVFSGM